MYRGERSRRIWAWLSFFLSLVPLQPCLHINRASTSSGTVALKEIAGTRIQLGSLGAIVQPTVYFFLGLLV